MISNKHLLAVLFVLGSSLAAKGVAAQSTRWSVGDRCELTKQVQMSAKSGGKGKKTKLDTGTTVDVMDASKAWAHVRAQGTPGYVKRRLLEKTCKLIEALPEASEETETHAEKSA